MFDNNVFVSFFQQNKRACMCNVNVKPSQTNTREADGMINADLDLGFAYMHVLFFSVLSDVRHTTPRHATPLHRARQLRNV